MDVTQGHASSMGPPILNSPNGDRTNEPSQHGHGEQQQSTIGGVNQPVGAAAAAQQPKVVQTAFIHKLYK